MKEILTDIDWMEDSTKNFAKDKVNLKLAPFGILSMVPLIILLRTSGTIGITLNTNGITNGTIGRTLNDIGLLLVPLIEP